MSPWQTIPRRVSVEPTWADKPRMVLGPSNPIITGGATGSATSVYWPTVINAEAILGGSALDTYYMYTSTDHAASAFVRYHTAPHPLGPWTPKGGDLTSGSSLGISNNETPSIVHVPEDPRPFWLYVHGGGGISQVTRLYTSVNGTTSWTQDMGLRFMHNPGNLGLLAVPSADQLEWEGDAHTGYFEPYRFAGRWFAKSLFGGTDYYAAANWHSINGRIWHADPRLLRYQPHVTADIAPWGPGFLFLWHGQLWALAGKNSIFISGVMSPDSELNVSLVQGDLRNPGTPVQVYDRVEAYETNGIRSLSVFTDVDGRAYVYVQYDNVIAAYTLEDS